MKLIDAAGPDGNAFAILGAVKTALTRAGRSSEWGKLREDMMSKNYDHLCEVAEQCTADLGIDQIKIVNR